MKRSKKMKILAATLLVVCAATVSLTKYEEKQEEIKNSDAVILEIDADTVETVSWEYDDSSLAFHKSDDKWVYDKDEAFPVSEEKINQILSHFEEFGTSFAIENVENYGQYGLDNPEATLNLTTEDGNSYEIKVGDYSKMDEKRYVDIGDGSVYLVSDDPTGFLDTELSSMILDDELPKLENIKDICFSGEQNYTITYEEESEVSYSEEDVYFTEINGESVPLDPDKIETYLNEISTLNLTGYVTYNATDEELKSYGLDDPEVSVTIDYITEDEEGNETEDTLVLHIGENVEEKQLEQEQQNQNEDEALDVTKYVRVGDSQIVYELADDYYDVLAAVSYDDLRHKQIIWADEGDISRIDILLEENRHTLTSELDDNDAKIWYYDGREIDISDLTTALYALSADEFTDTEADQKKEIELTVYLDDEDFPEVKINLYRYDGSTCLAKVNDESVSFISRSSVVSLIEAVQAIILD